MIHMCVHIYICVYPASIQKIHTYIEWAIDYRTYFEEINAKQRKSAEENNYTVYLKGLNVANLHGKY